jgi:hypothetical protein
MGMVKRIEPNSASLRCKADRRVGILEVQLEKLTPEIKKNILSEIRCLSICCISVQEAANIGKILAARAPVLLLKAAAPNTSYLLHGFCG